nr:MAG TPA: hypothetical protein [Siphoviridae sp. ct5pn1]
MCFCFRSSCYHNKPFFVRLQDVFCLILVYNSPFSIAYCSKIILLLL